MVDDYGVFAPFDCRAPMLATWSLKEDVVRYRRTISWCVAVAAGAICMIAPAAARADFTALTSPDQISGVLFTFDSLDVGFVSDETNAATQPKGFTFTDAGEPWPREIRQRLDDLAFPILRPVGIDLEIILIIRTQKRWAQVHRESYLGYDKIRGGELQYRRIRIFRGYLREPWRKLDETPTMTVTEV